ncbi:MAG: hypothetical protein GY940_13400 [bacterium]|nr:hypothetical protein [bacterium]
MPETNNNSLKALLKKAAIPALLGLVTLLTFKFIMWNSWKVDRAVNLAKQTINAHPAVNLTLSKGNDSLFRKSFPYNPDGNYYLVNRFDITPYITDTGSLTLGLSVNGEAASSMVLYRFKTFNILDFEDTYFVFTIEGSGIEAFVRLRNTIPFILDSLVPLYLGGGVNQGEKELLGEWLTESARELSYGRGRHLVSTAMTFEKNWVYELRFQYLWSGSGDAEPSIMVGSRPYGRGDILFRMPLETGLPAFVTGTYREGMILFCPVRDMVSPELHLMARKREKRGRFNGTIRFRNIGVYRYAKETEWPGTTISSRLTYFDRMGEVRAGFIEARKVQVTPGG